jgi:mannitol-specific phosphotransferase system IIBC component
MILAVLTIGAIISLVLALVYLKKKEKIDDVNNNLIPDQVEEAVIKTKNVVKETARRTKNVIDESKDVINELGDVVDAAKGKPTKKKYYYNSKKKK